MKRGDLVRLTNSDRSGDTFLYGGDVSPLTELDSIIPGDVPFGGPDIGIVVSRFKDPVFKTMDRFFLKLLTPKGLGWIFENRVEKVE